MVAPRGHHSAEVTILQQTVVVFVVLLEEQCDLLGREVDAQFEESVLQVQFGEEAFGQGVELAEPVKEVEVVLEADLLAVMFELLV